MSADRRGNPRFELQVEVGLATEDNFYTGLTQDLSGGGLFVATHQIREVGERIKITLSLPGQPQPFEIVTEVRWVRGTALSKGAGSPGMGLRFLQMSPQAKRAVRAFLHQRESIYYDDE
jgi:type IV pilus assembly protein PilZ